MKTIKALIGVFVLSITSAIYSADNIELKLFIFKEELKYHIMMNQIRETNDDVIQYIQEKFRYDLDIIIPKFKEKKRIINYDYSQQYEQKINLAKRQNRLPDIIVGDESVLNKYEVQKKPVYAEQIKKHAPYLYNQFTEKFWRYRDHTNDVYRIPIKKNVLYENTGFWVFRLT